MTVTDNRFAVIDADFYIKMTRYACDQGALFLQMMQDLGTQPVMHKYVADVELRYDPYVKQLISEGYIEIRDYEDYLISEKDKRDYANYFVEAYENMNRFDFPTNQDIYTYSCEDESLGEIRSIYMAKKLGYDYFMSDDGGAKRLANSFFKSIVVLNVYNALVECKKRGTQISLKQLNPTITNVFRERRDKLYELQEIFADKLEG